MKENIKYLVLVIMLLLISVGLTITAYSVIVIKDVILENTNFILNKNNYDFFSKLLDQKFIDVSFAVKNSNIFFRNAEKEVLFIS